MSTFTPESVQMLTIHEENRMLDSYTNYVDSLEAAGYLTGDKRAKSFAGSADCDKQEIDFLRGNSEMNLRVKLTRAQEHAACLDVKVTGDINDLDTLRISSKDVESRYTSKEFIDDLNVRSDTKKSNSSTSSRRSAEDFMGDMVAQKRTRHHKSSNALLAGAEKFRAFCYRDNKKA